jgi:hypothetical protein
MEQCKAPVANKRLRDMIMQDARPNPILAYDIETGNTQLLRKKLAKEYRHQRRQVKKGLRKHISVDYNDMYC